MCKSLFKNEITFCLTHSSLVNKIFFFLTGSKIYFLLSIKFILCLYLLEKFNSIMSVISNVEEYKEVLKKIKNNFFESLYIINSEEIFFSNDFTEKIKKIIPEDQKDFNQYLFFGNEIKFEDVLLIAKKFPMMGERQLIIVKGGNKILNDIIKNISQIKNIPKSTVLVICTSGVKIERKKNELKKVFELGIIYDFKKIYDNKMASWIKFMAERFGFQIEYKICELIRERTGNNLSKVNIELEKLALNKLGSIVNSDVIIEHFGINNDYNLFELQNEIGKKNYSQVYKISNYFSKNSSFSIQQILSTLHNYFTNIFQIHTLNNDNPSSISKTLGINYFFINDYLIASKNYNIREVVKILRILNSYDLKSKGINYEGNSNNLINQLVSEIIN